MSASAYYSEIARHYESCLEAHGPGHLGVDWPNPGDLATRFEVMLALFRSHSGVPPEVLDLGCGTGLLLDHLEARTPPYSVRYTGIDISSRMIAVARTRWPSGRFEARDILVEPLPDASFDYVIMNGLLTEKASLTQEQMVEFAEAMISAAYNACRIGIAFNVMSYHVDWKRPDLFHWSLDEIAGFLKRRCSRNWLVRADYGLWEYTIYVYREPPRAG